jgi:hypothetical protein
MILKRNYLMKKMNVRMFLLTLLAFGMLQSPVELEAKMHRKTARCAYAQLVTLAGFLPVLMRTGKWALQKVKYGRQALGLYKRSVPSRFEDENVIKTDINALSQDIAVGVVLAGITAIGLPILSRCVNLTVETEIEWLQKQVEALEQSIFVTEPITTNPDTLRYQLAELYPGSSQAAALLLLQNTLEEKTACCTDLIDSLDAVRTQAYKKPELQEQCDTAIDRLVYLLKTITANKHAVEQLTVKHLCAQ